MRRQLADPVHWLRMIVWTSLLVIGWCLLAAALGDSARQAGIARASESEAFRLRLSLERDQDWRAGLYNTSWTCLTVALTGLAIGGRLDREPRPGEGLR